MKKIYPLVLAFVMLIPTSPVFHSVTEYFSSNEESNYESTSTSVVPQVQSEVYPSIKRTLSKSAIKSLDRDSNFFDEAKSELDIDEESGRMDFGTIEQIQVIKPFRFLKVQYNKSEFYKYDSVTHKFVEHSAVLSEQLQAITTFAVDPIRFRMSADKVTVGINEEVEITITAEFVEISPRTIFTLEGSNEYALKLLLPEGFVQTGGTYYDFIRGNVSKTRPKEQFTIKGKFETIEGVACFSLLRGHSEAGADDLWIKKSDLCLQQGRLTSAKTEDRIRVENSQANVSFALSGNPSCTQPFTMSINQCKVGERFTPFSNNSQEQAKQLKYIKVSYRDSPSDSWTDFSNDWVQTGVQHNWAGSISTDSVYSVSMNISTGSGCRDKGPILRREYQIKCRTNPTDDWNTSNNVQAASAAIEMNLTDCYKFTDPSIIQASPVRIPFGETTTTLSVAANTCRNATNVKWYNGSNTFLNKTGYSQNLSEGVYKVRCESSVCNSAFSSPVTIERIAAPSAPVLSSNKSTLCAGENALLEAAGCNAGGTIRYEQLVGSNWQVLSSNIVAAGTYRAFCLQSGVASVSSNQITIANSVQTVSPPGVSIQGATGTSASICGSEGAVTLLASGCYGGKITWNNGQEGSSMTIVAAGGTYSAICSQYCGSTTLTSAASQSLIISYQPVCNCNTITISSNTINSQIPERNTLVLSVPEIPNVNYRWHGPDIPSSVDVTKATLTIPNVSVGNSGDYSVEVSCRGSSLHKTITVIDIDECANSFFHFAYSLSPNGETGVGEELRFVAGGGDRYEWHGPNGFYSTEQFPIISAATFANRGNYTVKISRLIDGTWCDKYVGVEVNIGNCSFDAGPTYTETSTTFQLQMWANKPLDGAIFEWSKGGSVISTIGNPTLPKNSSNTGTYTLKVNLRGCIVEKNIRVDYISPSQFDGHLDVATCDEVSGWIIDENNKHKSLSYTIKIKVDNNEIPYVIRTEGNGNITRFKFTNLAAYKDGLQHTVVVYLPNGSLFRNTTSRFFRCCTLEFEEAKQSPCDLPSTAGGISVKVKNTLRGGLQYYLEKQGRNEEGQVTYTPAGVWQVPSGNTASYAYSNLTAGIFRVTAREGSNGCAINTVIPVFCENIEGCNNINVTVFPTGEIREGIGLAPKLYASTQPEQSPNNPPQAGLEMDGNARLSFTNYNYIFGNLTLEAWINPRTGATISVGDASDASRQKYLFRGWNGAVSNRAAAQLSVGSNGINLIEEGDGYRRLALSYEGLITGWNHVAVVYRNNLPTLMLNGQVVASSTIAPPLNIQIVGPLALGADKGKGFTGSVYGFRVWTAALENVVVNQHKNNFEPLLTAYPNVGFWVFDKPVTGDYVEDLSNGKRRAKLEGSAMVLVPPSPVQSPNVSDITWWLNGSKVGTGSTYTVPLNKVRAGTLNYTAKYQKSDGSYCETAVPIVIAPANFGSLSGCYVIQTVGGEKPIAPFYSPNVNIYNIKKSNPGQNSEKQIWRFEHLGNEIYRINSAFFTDMALEASPNGIVINNKRISELAQQWKANVVDAAAYKFSLSPQNQPAKRLQYYWEDESPLGLSNGDDILEHYLVQPVACPLPASDCNVNNKITYERWLQGSLQSMSGAQWANLNVAQHIQNNPNPYAVQVALSNFSIMNGTPNSFPGRPSVWPDSRYVNRLSGYLCAPKNGDYTFYIRTDDWAELWMSTDEDPSHKRLIAKCTSYANSFVSNPYEQRSLPITLSKGRSYYFEVILKDEINALFAEVAWQTPDNYIAEHLLQAMPLTNISSIPRDITPGVMTVAASSLKVVPTENVTLTASGCDYGRVIWKAGLEVIQNPSTSLTTLTRQGPGIYQAMCVGDYTVNQDWVVVKVDLNGSITPVVNSPGIACPAKVVTLTASNAPANTSQTTWGYEWFVVNNQQAWRENYSSMPNIFDDMPGIFNKSTGTTINVTGPGTYYVRVVSSNGYKSPVKEYTVQPAIPASLKAINDSPTPIGNPVVLTATDIAGATYAWTGPNFTANTRIATRGNFDASMAGNYTVTITTAASAGGCTATATTTVVASKCDIYLKATNPANNQETYTLPRKTGGAAGFNPLNLKIENFDGSSGNFSAYNVQWMLNGNPLPDAPNATSISTDKIGEYVAILSLKIKPENTCEARVNINAVPCKVYDGVPTCGTAPSNIVVPSTTQAGVNLAAGDRFTVGDYTVVVTQIISGNSAGWNGKGYIEFRLINNIAINKVSVTLENVVINDCYQLAGGRIVTEYDESWRSVLDADQIVENVKDIAGGLEGFIDDFKAFIEVDFKCNSSDIEQLNKFKSRLEKIKSETQLLSVFYSQTYRNAVLAQITNLLLSIDKAISQGECQVLKFAVASLDELINGDVKREEVGNGGSSNARSTTNTCGYVPMKCVDAAHTSIFINNSNHVYTDRENKPLLLELNSRIIVPIAFYNGSVTRFIYEGKEYSSYVHATECYFMGYAPSGITTRKRFEEQKIKFQNSGSAELQVVQVTDQCVFSIKVGSTQISTFTQTSCDCAVAGSGAHKQLMEPTIPILLSKSAYISKLKSTVTIRGKVANGTQTNGYPVFVYVTDHNSPAALIAEIQNHASNLGKKDIVLWVKFEEQGDVAKYQFYYGDGIAKEKRSPLYEKLIEAMPDPAFWGISFNPIVALAKGIADLIGEAKIPAKYWNCREPESKFLKFLANIPSTEGGDYLIPFICGLWNGIVSEVQGIPELIAILSDATQRSQMVDGILALTTSEGWGVLTSKLVEDYNSKNSCEISEAVGEGVVAVASIFLGVEFVSSGKKLDVILKLTNPISDLANLSVKLAKFTKTGAVKGYYIIEGFASKAIKVSNIAGKVVIDVSGQVIRGVGDIFNVSFSPSVQLSAEMVSQGGRYGLKINNAIYFMEEIARETSEKVIGTVKKGNDEILLIFKTTDSWFDQLAETYKNAHNWSELKFKTFKDDFSNKPLRDKFKSGELDPRAWEIMHDAERSNLKVGFNELKQLTEMLRDPDFALAFGSDINKAFTDICKANNAGSYKGGGSLSGHLTTIQWFVNKYNGIEGWLEVVKEMRIAEKNRQDGLFHMLHYLKAKNIDKSQFKKFDMEFEAPDRPCIKCRFDVLLIEKVKPRFLEFKSYSLESVKNIATHQIGQFKNYLNEAKELEEVAYIFNKLKTNEINLVKEQFKVVFMAPGVFDLIWENKGLRESLWDDLPAAVPTQIRIEKQLEFESWVNSRDDRLFKIIDSD